MRTNSNGQEVSTPAPRLAAGLQLLLQSRQLAQQVERNIWEFAVEKGCLTAAGIRNSDLRWMICEEIIEHAIEVEDHSESSRQFYASTELRLEDRSCFVLTLKGERLAQATALPAAVTYVDHLATNARRGQINIENRNGAPLHAASQIVTPIWDGARHQLRVGSTIVKEYKLPSPNQETILAAFDEEGWPPCIDDPLPMHPDLDPKRRLHDTIKSLNRNQRTRKIRFMGDGTGEGVRWEWIVQTDKS